MMSDFLDLLMSGYLDVRMPQFCVSGCSDVWMCWCLSLCSHEYLESGCCDV